MKKQIRCYFTDFWPEFDYKYNLDFLLSEYEIVLDKENPDYLFCSCFGHEHLLYDQCIKIFYSGENAFPDLNLYDYAESESEIQCGDRTLYNCTSLFRGRNAFQPDLNGEKLLDRKFCNFVYSNNQCADPFREKIFNALSKYKRIDSGGAFLNNMGGMVKDKQAFLKEYKFTLAIENSSQPGYVTEKIFDPFRAQSLPVYWGSPSISSNYRSNSFVNLMDFSSIEEAVEEVIRLDKDDAAYLEKITTPFWPYGDRFEEFYDSKNEKRMAFYRNIFDQPLDKSRRRTEYGWVKVYRENMKQYYCFQEQLLKKKYLGVLRGIAKKIIRK